MMYKLLGSILVMSCCFYIAWLKNQENKVNIQKTKEFIFALDYIKREITQNHRLLPHILKNIGTRDKTFVGIYCQNLLDQIEGDDGNSFAIKWKNSLEDSLDLPKELMHILEPMGFVLGQYDSKSQGDAISSCLDDLERLKQQQTEESGKMVHVYTTLGGCFGIFLIIILL